MELKQFNSVIEEQIKICSDMLIVKGDEYVRGQDRLSAFKKAAAIQDETPKQALLGMLTKHLVSISDMCIDGKYTKERWTEKITDSVNYLLILKAIVEEELNNG